jgi:c-di-GMP-related signal transduction protein
MFTLDATIDAVQNGKKQFVKTFVQNETIADALTKFVDAQTEYTKNAVKVSTNTVTTLTEEAVKATKQISSIDYAKMVDSFTNSAKPAKK